ncbi:DEAD-domain-containing protein [Tilletiaria anomala UBC 951]|uniref:RNA helicase n=1 Tax=Tilletiaria anomala (strain ATCC 24038 / CBS 436.72 / UBC 951) TaxID=1037660 RepID=A0A066WIY2_TILAU|nr:DEAD-domain-containing protein [Tilletiaria anomala UBC 951]KDN52508.1 DEAD-domain-containing protein [Tilletiaria anomala UBC 951]
MSDKEQRKLQRKAQKKLLQEQQNGTAPILPSEVSSTPSQDVISEQANLEKKRKLDSSISPAPGVHDNDDGAESKEASRAAKKARKAAKKAKREVEKTVLPETPSNLDSRSLKSSAKDGELTAAKYLADKSITLENADDGSAIQASAVTSFAILQTLVHGSIMSVIQSQNFTEPTPIQAACWPLLLQGRDVVGIAETGSGKTFAFGVPAIEAIIGNDNKKDKKDGVSTLVIAPTRELAIQTQEQMSILGKGCKVDTFCVYGGVSKDEQIKALKRLRPSAIVGTPGRLLDLARDGHLDLSGVSYLVLDEADRMLDKGFEPDIRALIGMTKSHAEKRLTCMFSATWPPAVRKLAESFMHNPAKVTVGSDELAANRRITQTVYVLEGREKEWKLQDVLRNYYKAKPNAKNDRILIFALYKKEAQRVENTLRRQGHSVAGIHGDLSQHDRISSLNTFKSAATPLLVATDVAARGLDIPNVELVINYTFPLTAEDYVHRIGRTGRGGKDGRSITFFTDEDKAHAGELIRILKDADQPVPEEMDRFPKTIKKKSHAAYGDHVKEFVAGKAKKITFD